MQLDFVRMFEDYGITYSYSSSHWINIQCPHCGDTGQHLGIHIEGQYANCWKCGGHNIEYTIKKILGITTQTLEELLQKYSVRYALFNKVNKRQMSVQEVPVPGHPLERMHQRYLINRGFDPDELVNKYRITGTGVSDGEWGYRIIIPIIYNGKVVSYQGRAIKKNMTRYKTLEVDKSAISPKDILFNMDNCRSKRAVVVEGPFDAMRIGDGVIATLGIGMTLAQMELLAVRYSSIVFLFDPEVKAQERAKKHSYTLLSELEIQDVSVVDMEWEHDPGSLTDEEVAILKKELKI